VPALLAVGFDATILNLALPELATGLHASSLQLQWFIAGYTLVFAAAMIPGGMMGDRFGRKRMQLIALTLFGASSLAAAYAGTSAEFIAARAVLGAGAAIVLPMVLGVIPALFGEHERPKAVAVVMTATTLGFPIGPILGGYLLTHYWWGSVFLINIPVVAIALFGVIFFVPETRSPKPPRFDPLGIIASSLGLAALVYGVIEAGTYGWSDVLALAPIAAGVLVLAGFVWWESRVPEPLVDLALFKAAGFTWGTLLSTTVNFVMFGVLFVLPQYFQAVLGTDAMGSGVRLLPLVAGLLVGAGVADRLAKPLGTKATIGLGFAILAAGLLLGATTTAGSTNGQVMLWTTICGVGLGFAMPAAMSAAIDPLSEENGGVGSGVIQAVRMVGGSFGSALLGSLLYSGYRSRLDLSGLPARAAAAVRESQVAGLELAAKLHLRELAASIEAAFTHGMDVVLVVCGGLAALGAVFGVIFIPNRAASPAASGEDAKVDVSDSIPGHSG
jgi:EmrB/QacA subfamily drug resistance transporter